MSVDALWAFTGTASTRPDHERCGYFLLEDGRMIVLTDAAHAVGMYRIEGGKMIFRAFVSVHNPVETLAAATGARPYGVEGVGELGPDRQVMEYVAHLTEQPEVILRGRLQRIAEIPNFRKLAGMVK